jgi:hypothetical protein
MTMQHRPRVEPRLVFAVVLVAIPVLYVVAQVIFFRPSECGNARDTQVGGVSQLFLPGDGCKEQPPGR